MINPNLKTSPMMYTEKKEVLKCFNLSIFRLKTVLKNVVQHKRIITTNMNPIKRLQSGNLFSNKSETSKETLEALAIIHHAVIARKAHFL
jgi:hypothetical protein